MERPESQLGLILGIMNVREDTRVLKDHWIILLDDRVRGSDEF